MTTILNILKNNYIILGISGLNNALITPFIRTEVIEKNITINILNKKKEENKSKINKKGQNI